MTSKSRRNFLKATVLTGMAVATTPRVHAKGSGKIKLGLIGCGSRGPGALLDAFNAGDDLEIVALGDFFRYRAKAIAEGFNESFPDRVNITDDMIFDGFDNYKGVIERADAVLIACAAKFHPFYTKAAVEAGKHVFVEKPHGIDAHGIHILEEAIELARRKNLSLASGLHSRYSLPYKALVEKIHEGALGDILSIECKFFRAPYGVYLPKEGMSELESQIHNQYHFHWISGDDFIQSLVHNVDRAVWTRGGDYPIDATGVGGRASMFGKEYGDVFDHHSAYFRYPDESRIYGFCRTETHCYDEYNDLIIGTKGKADWNSATITGETNWRYEGDDPSPHRLVQIDFIDSIRKGTPINHGNYMAKSTMMAILGQMACYTGKQIGWDECYQSKFCVAPAPEDCVATMEPPVLPNALGNSYPTAIPGQSKWW